MNVRDGLYHEVTGIPWHLFDEFAGKFWDLDYGQHARRAALDDKYGQLTSVPLNHCFTPSEVFEVEVEQGRVVKFAARLTVGNGFTVKTNALGTHWPHELDLILVCVPSLRDSNNLFVKTLWLQEREDSHKTLNRSRYTPYAPTPNFKV